MFLAHPPSALQFAIGLDESTLRWHHAELLKNKKNVVWPDRDSQVGELLWDELDHRCSDGEPALCSS